MRMNPTLYRVAASQDAFFARRAKEKWDRINAEPPQVEITFF